MKNDLADADCNNHFVFAFAVLIEEISNHRRLRIERRISKEKLCAELQRRGCNIGRTTYEKYESGELNIRMSVLIELKKIYGCSYDDFFSGLDTKVE